MNTGFEAVILCGGSAKRMKPYLPFNKPLAEIAQGVTLIEHQVDWLTRNGAEQITLAIDHETYTCLDASLLSSVQCMVEPTRLGTCGAVKQAAILVSEPVFYLMNVDDIIASATYSPSQLLSRLDYPLCGAMLITQTRLPYGVLEIEGEYIVGFREKPTLSHWVNTGHYALTRRYVEKCFPAKGDLDLVLPSMASGRRLVHMMLDGDWITVNNIKQLEEARTKLANNILPSPVNGSEREAKQTQ